MQCSDSSGDFGDGTEGDGGGINVELGCPNVGEC